MLTATLQRDTTGPDGTFGVLVAGPLRLEVAEPPWFDNAKGRSCIPPGKYPCVWHRSPRFGAVYKLQDTAPRSEVLIHRGNYAGDVGAGRRTHSQGCLLPGLRRGMLLGQAAVLNSKAAYEQLEHYFQQRDFLLEILPIKPGMAP